MYSTSRTTAKTLNSLAYIPAYISTPRPILVSANRITADLYNNPSPVRPKTFSKYYSHVHSNFGRRTLDLGRTPPAQLERSTPSTRLSKHRHGHDLQEARLPSVMKKLPALAHHAADRA